MCCSRGHYPKEVGVWQTDAVSSHHHEGDEIIGGLCEGNDDHLHFVLPPTKDETATVCIKPEGRSGIYMKWDNWHEGSGDAGSLSVEVGVTMTDEEVLRLRDLLAVTIAESGRISRDLEPMLESWAAENYPNWGVVCSWYAYDDEDFLRGMVGDDVPEYHEWLVMQAAAENRHREEGMHAVVAAG